MGSKDIFLAITFLTGIVLYFPIANLIKWFTPSKNTLFFILGILFLSAIFLPLQNVLPFVDSMEYIIITTILLPFFSIPISEELSQRNKQISKEKSFYGLFTVFAFILTISVIWFSFRTAESGEWKHLGSFLLIFILPLVGASSLLAAIFCSAIQKKFFTNR